MSHTTDLDNSPVTSKLHLYQPVRYRAGDGNWYATFSDALRHSGNQLTWDSAAVLSVLSFGYVCGDRTLVKEIKRQPWLSQIGIDGEPILQPIPGHQRRWATTRSTATELQRLLCEEALAACQGHSEVYILLSGGLDSRVVAGIVGYLVREGRLRTKPVCVTWGLPDSRDVVYSKKTANILGLEWHHLTLEHCDLQNNIDISAEKLGAMVSAAHLHRMTWFANVDPNAVVLAASYGDMVGRAEFSGLQLLEIDYLKPSNSFALLNPLVFSNASRDLNVDFQTLHDRSPGQPKYVICEHEMHAHYTRGMLAQAMSLINHYCTVYQMFTHPDVYSHMWSLHPAVRNDDTYAVLLERLDPNLARLPWARTNRALKGKTAGADPTLLPHFNQYNEGIAESLFEKLSQIIGSDWLAETGLFQVDRVRQLSDSVKRKVIDPRYYDAYDIFIWLASLKRFIDYCKQLEIHITQEHDTGPSLTTVNPLPKNSAGKIRATLRNIPALYRFIKFLRRRYYRILSILKYLPEL